MWFYGSTYFLYDHVEIIARKPDFLKLPEVHALNFLSRFITLNYHPKHIGPLLLSHKKELIISRLNSKMELLRKKRVMRWVWRWARPLLSSFEFHRGAVRRLQTVTHMVYFRNLLTTLIFIGRLYERVVSDWLVGRARDVEQMCLFWNTQYQQKYKRHQRLAKSLLCQFQ